MQEPSNVLLDAGKCIEGFAPLPRRPVPGLKFDGDNTDGRVGSEVLSPETPVPWHHGCSTALAKLIELIAPQPDDVIVPLGDFVDRGIDSKGVIEQLISLGDRCRFVPILGNHEEMMLGAREGWSDFRFWINCGGLACLDSYGSTGRIDFIPSHFGFLESCRTYFETERHFFVHANYKPEVPLDRLDMQTLRWRTLRDYVPSSAHCSGKIAVVGHTPKPEVLDLGYLKCLDTNCCYGGWISALDVDTNQLWQVDEKGEVRA